ncbi:DUF6069 family protein [Rhodococcus sp. NPDC060084]|uniref:DUF6069 family protein n=1 Tax=unclassified Rhodococcus (in: high G+C Gram-positive bacteria) TaxID=192944 RepID=UPI00365AC9E3
MTASETSRSSSVSAAVRVPDRLVVVVATVLLALVVNLVVWLVGLAAGGSFEHTDAGTVASAAPGGVVLMTAGPLAAGLALAALLSLWWSGFLRIAQVVGALLPLATIQGTVVADFDTASTAALVTMHVVVAAAAVAGLEVLRHRGRAGHRRALR